MLIVNWVLVKPKGRQTNKACNKAKSIQFVFNFQTNHKIYIYVCTFLPFFHFSPFTRAVWLFRYFPFVWKIKALLTRPLKAIITTIKWWIFFLWPSLFLCVCVYLLRHKSKDFESIERTWTIALKKLLGACKPDNHITVGSPETDQYLYCWARC